MAKVTVTAPEGSMVWDLFGNQTIEPGETKEVILTALIQGKIDNGELKEVKPAPAPAKSAKAKAE